MTDTFRALCAELLDELELWSSWHDATDLKDRAAAALHFVQLAPIAPTDEELIEPIVWMIDDCVYATNKGDVADSLRELIARWGTPTAKSLSLKEQALIQLTQLVVDLDRAGMKQQASTLEGPIRRALETLND